MVDKTLLKYIKSELAKGFDINTIKRHLIEHGYRIDMVERAIHYIYAPKHISKSTIVIIISLVLSFGLIIGAFFTYFYPKKAAGTLLDVEVDLYKQSLERGEYLEFNVELTNLGAEKRYDVSLRYFIKDSKGKIVNSKEQTIAIETRASKKLSIKIPEDSLKGNYNLYVIARYDSKEARASGSFSVKKKKKEEPEEEPTEEPEEEPSAECPKSCDDNNDCTEDYCSWETDYECKHDIIELCCGNNLCEDGEDYENCEKDCALFYGLTMYDRIEKIKEIAVNDPETAGGYCKEIQQVTYRDLCFVGLAEVTKLIDNCKYVEEERAKDKCYSTVAEVTNDSRICERVSTDSRRDSCYLTFVMNKDYSVCNKIVNEYLRNSCNTLSEIQQ